MGGKSQHSKRKAALAAAQNVDPFGYLVWRFKRERDQEAKVELAKFLLPYVKARLKSVDVSATMTSTVEVVIGGDDC